MLRLAGVLLFAACLAGAAADWDLYACISTTKEYVVGAKLLPSGVFRRTPEGAWELTGHATPFAFGIDYDRRDPAKIYVAGGNGIIRLRPGKPDWRILTSSDVTEMRDVALAGDGSIYYGYVAGVRVSRDGGSTWRQLRDGYTESIRLDRTHRDVLIIGTDNGIYRTEDDGGTWKLAGADGFSITRVEQSPHDECLWLAGTEQGGLFASRDCGRTFENAGRIGVGRVIYDIAFDPGTPGRVALAGWGLGVLVSEDSGKTWQARNAQLPSTNIWSIAYDPSRPGRLLAGLHEEALYISEDNGVSWRPAGLPGGIIYRIRFVPEVKQ